MAAVEQAIQRPQTIAAAFVCQQLPVLLHVGRPAGGTGLLQKGRTPMAVRVGQHNQGRRGIAQARRHHRQIIGRRRPQNPVQPWP